ncbi:MAG: gliding motility lipoprotein GldH [Sphingomonadales bacterium]|jgi:gliding motility-associated lipoprotein GldH
MYRLLSIIGIVFLLTVPLFQSCTTDQSVLLNQFEKTEVSGWQWGQGKKFTFTVEDSTYYYSLSCGLRITSGYSYSNIWLLYRLDGPVISQKNQFEIVLSDNTGKWLGQGQGNLISYEKPFVGRLKLRPGRYTLEIAQNMRDEKLTGVSDVGLKVIKAGKIY